MDWSNAQNICRQHCMNLVSLETPAENNFVKVGGVLRKMGLFTKLDMIILIPGTTRFWTTTLHLDKWKEVE